MSFPGLGMYNAAYLMGAFEEGERMADNMMQRGAEAMKVAQVVKNGMEDKTSSARLKEIMGILRKHHAGPQMPPEKLVDVIEELGPTFVKLGQIMSSRRDLFPAEYCDAMASLRSNATPLTFTQVETRLNEAYGGNWGTAFESIAARPLGSASIAQVHKARLHDGTVVAVKVQRPNIKEEMLNDLELLRRANDLLELTAMRTGENGLDISAFVDELDRTTRDELDFRNEAKNLRDFHKNTEDNPHVTSPRVYMDLTGESVLVMDYVRGPHIDDKPAVGAMGVDVERCGEIVAESFIAQLLQDGLFHADPHPGNIIVQPGGDIEWIDLGMVGRLSSTERELLTRLLIAVMSRDAQALKSILLVWGTPDGEVDHGRLLSDIDSLLTRYASDNIADMDISAAVTDVLSAVQRQHIVMPASFTSLGRGLITLEGTLEAVSPNISIMDALKNYFKGHLLDGFDPQQDLVNHLFKMKKLRDKSIDIPSQVSDLLDLTTKGELGVKVSVRDLDPQLRKLEGTIDRMTLGLIVAGLFIGSSMLCLTGMQPQVLGVPLIGFLGYLGALVLSIYIVVKGRG